LRLCVWQIFSRRLNYMICGRVQNLPVNYILTC
jgi:hypothetical protein